MSKAVRFPKDAILSEGETVNGDISTIFKNVREREQRLFAIYCLTEENNRWVVPLDSEEDAQKLADDFPAYLRYLEFIEASDNLQIIPQPIPVV